MEHTAEVNELVDGSAEAFHMKRTENVEANHHPGSSEALEKHPDRFTCEDARWPEKFSLIPPEILLENMASRSLSCSRGSQSQSEPLCTSPRASSSPAVMVEELTVKNFRGPNFLLDDISSREERHPVRPDFWKNFTRLNSQILVKKTRETSSIGHRDNVGNASQPPLGNQRQSLALQFEKNSYKASERTIEKGKQAILTTPIMKSPGAMRTDTLHASGFRQYFIKSTLKGKGVSFIDQRANDVNGKTIPEQSIGIPKATSGYNMMEKPDAKVDNIAFLCPDDGRPADSLTHNEVSLRVWLTCRQQKYNKADKVRIFKHIVDFVDICHSQGIALCNLQPSYFIMSPSNEVKYTGSFFQRGQIVETCSLVTQNLDLFRNRVQSKRHLELEKGNRECGMTKHPKIYNEYRTNIAHHIHDRKSYPGNINQGENFRDNRYTGRNTCANIKELTRDNRYSSINICGSKVSSYNGQQAMPELMNLEERWYASPEDFNENRCPFSSNIYSLGVLLFELIACFETWELHSAAMSDLRHRILPPNILSESPKEAGFCLWLLHPEPSSRPKSRDVLQNHLISETPDLSSLDYSAALIEEEDSEADLLLHFLSPLREQKEKHTANLMAALKFINADLEEVERRQSSKKNSLSNGKNIQKDFGDPCTIAHGKSLACSETTIVSKSGPYEGRLMQNMEQLENAYFLMRSSVEMLEAGAVTRSDNDVLKIKDRYQQLDIAIAENEGTDSVGAFFGGLCKYACYSKFQLRGCLKNVDILNSANVICSLGFDRDEEYLAAAGISKKIKIFEYDALLNDGVDIHYPLVEMSCRSKLSCISWNNYIKNYLSSTDYEGVVQLWDASTNQGLAEFVEHQKRAWSVHFSPVDPTRLASGSDDCSVKLWSINEKRSIDTIRNTANVCTVQFSSHSTHLLACGSADYRIYCYDLRNTRIPWCTLAGHGKAVSYVKFLDSASLVSASTDNTLKLWDLNRTNPSGLSTSACSLTFSGHTNEKNFVGLSVCNGYITCGSETNEVFAYYRTFPMPVTSYKFGSVDPITAQETDDANGQFVSSVCWREKSNVVVSANSSGSIKVLQLV